jgi:hypothetical protein
MKNISVFFELPIGIKDDFWLSLEKGEIPPRDNKKMQPNHRNMTNIVTNNVPILTEIFCRK